MKRADKALILVTVIAVGLFAAFLFPYVFRRFRTEQQSLSHRVMLIEKHRMRRIPFFGTSEIVEEQTLQFEGRTIWSARMRWPGELAGGFHVSPNEEFVAIESWLHDKPIRILNTGTGDIVLVHAPEELDPFKDFSSDMHYFVYPFGFVKWSEDSQRFTVEVTGAREKEGHGYVDYRDLWEVEVKTSKATRVKRKEQP